MLPQHSHISEVYAIKTTETRLADQVLEFVKTGNHSTPLLPAPPCASETTVFKSLGMAVEDIVAALLVYRSAAQT